MIVRAELYGSRFGDNNITDAFKDRTFQIRVDFLDEKAKHSFILNKDEALTLVKAINASFSAAGSNGLEVG